MAFFNHIVYRAEVVVSESMFSSPGCLPTARHSFVVVNIELLGVFADRRAASYTLRLGIAYACSSSLDNVGPSLLFLFSARFQFVSFFLLAPLIWDCGFAICKQLALANYTLHFQCSTWGHNGDLMDLDTMDLVAVDKSGA